MADRVVAAGAVLSVACHAGGALAACGHEGGSARVFCPSTGETALALWRHGGPVASVAFGTGQGHEVTIGCNDGSARIFDLRKGDQPLQVVSLHQCKYSEGCLCVSYSDAGWLATAGADASMAVLARR
mmetsp:Transcript_100262/g.272601  ORF Transcript_100262/g.272601 Transcript_100262/m.272601 type:complete len:128 (+) Transcript_100262:3-386(+)